MDERVSEGVTPPDDVKRQVDAIARRLGCDSGEWILEFKILDGSLANTRRHHGPIRNEELSRLTRTEP